MIQYINKSALVAEIERRMTPECGYTLNKLLDYIDTLEVKEVQEEPVSENLEEAANDFAEGEWDGLHDNDGNALYDQDYVEYAFKAGAEWQKNHLWKSAEGPDLPIINREVIALLDNCKVVFAHRPPEYWDGKNIITGKVTRNYPKTYDKGGWNIPDVKFWLDVEPPKEIEL